MWLSAWASCMVVDQRIIVRAGCTVHGSPVVLLAISCVPLPAMTAATLPTGYSNSGCNCRQAKEELDTLKQTLNTIANGMDFTH